MRYPTKRPYMVELTPEAYGAMHAEARRSRATLRQTASRLILEAIERPAPVVEIVEPARSIPTAPSFWECIKRLFKGE